MHTYDLNKGKLCETLCAALRNDILTGVIASGERLPSKRRLAEHHGISVTTVQNAYEQLIAEGYIEARERRGYFALSLAPQLSQAPRTVPQIKATHTRRAALDLVTNAPEAAQFPFALWSRLMRRVLSEEHSRLLAPLPASGVSALRQAIAAYLGEARGIAVSPEQIVIGAGTEYLYSLLPQLLGRERCYGLENPGHSKIARIYALNGVEFSPIDVDASGVSRTALQKSAVSVLHISPNHHFPTGAVMPATRRRELLYWAGEGDRYIIEDDYDSEFRHQGKPIPPLFGMDTAGRVIYVNTFSKTIAPSMRISYMVLPVPLLTVWRERLGFYSCPVPAFEQYALAHFLSGGYFEKHLRRMRTFYRARRDAIIDLLASAPFAGQIRIKEADAGLHFLLEVQTHRSDEELRALLQKADIRAAFLQDYRIDGAHPDTHTIVCNYSGVEPAQLAAGIARLAALLF